MTLRCLWNIWVETYLLERIKVEYVDFGRYLCVGEQDMDEEPLKATEKLL